ncbi:CPBP family intramembrane glutamic endopeptidase [Butyrivibrio sp. NC2002]|uniref:CPBP family intramembrane glutamic endopeptidase n=1 Tax=Butyrivibrio sp. NC2002 TaxID=1410610 RepID=UPI00055EFF06|nr:type II CAAX endopeptidase family protein [Butyrivibrio sp. NC2002]
MKTLFKQYAFPVIWELLFIISYLIIPDTYKTLGLFMVFYLGICIYYYKEFSFHRYFKNFNKVKTFWAPIVLAFAAVVILDVVKTTLLSNGLISIATDMYSITRKNTPLAEAMFGLTTILLQPIAEELFFRKAIIMFDSKRSTLITVIIGLILCGFAHSYMPLGFTVTVIFAVPFAIAYVYSKNVYVPMTAHILYMAYVNLPNIIYDLARISMQ